MEIYNITQLEKILEENYNDVTIVKLTEDYIPDNLFIKLFNFNNLSHLIISIKNQALLAKYYNYMANFSKLLYFQMSNFIYNLRVLNDIPFFYLDDKILWMVQLEYCDGCLEDRCNLCGAIKMFKYITMAYEIKKINIINIFPYMLYLLDNLPNSLEYLQIKIVDYNNSQIELLNLPPLLKTLRIVINKQYKATFSHNIKVPYGCDFQIIEK